MEWFEEAVWVAEDVIRVAVAMGGESTHRRATIKTKALIHLHLDLRSTHIEPGGRCSACLQGFSGRESLA
jgi:hypothetical protein